MHDYFAEMSLDEQLDNDINILDKILSNKILIALNSTYISKFRNNSNEKNLYIISN